MFRVGAHFSASGGIENARQKMLEVGGDCLQVFASSPLRWQIKDSGSFSEPVVSFFHAPYLINLNGGEELFNKSVQCLINHMKIVEREKGEGLIFHPGSKKIGQQVKKGIEMVLAKTKGNLIIENSANKAGSDPEEIFWIMKNIDNKRLLFCLDTAHAFEAGHLNQEWPQPVVIHANDSATASGSKNDRHARIGEGLIGIEKFQELIKKYNDIPWIMEIPGEVVKEDINNLRKLWTQSKK
jgi:deoxyribonuclease IV